MRVRTTLLLTLWCLSYHSKSTAQDGFISLDTVLRQSVLEPMYFGTENFIGDTIDGYLTEKILLSIEAASALSRVEARLNKEGLGLKILDGYRPQTAVDHFIRWSKNPSDTVEKYRYYPDVRKEQLFDKGYIAERSGHSRGSAVDLTLVDLETGIELDMGSKIDYFGPISHPNSTAATAAQRKNRNILRKAMEEEGFVPLETEWWHFSLKNEPFPNTYFSFPVE